MKLVLLLTLAGVCALGWTGSSLAAGLQMTRSVEVNLAGFAIAIVVIASAPVRALSARVRALEAVIASGDGEARHDHVG